MRVTLGHGDDKELLRRIRVHANFGEYVPLALIMAAFTELQAPSIVVHVICISLLVGRVSHAVGVSRQDENFKYRVAGMAMTFTSLILSALTILLRSVM